MVDQAGNTEALGAGSSLLILMTPTVASSSGSRTSARTTNNNTDQEWYHEARQKLVGHFECCDRSLPSTSYHEVAQATRSEIWIIFEAACRGILQTGGDPREYLYG
ncbi:hypothetical protein EDD18DRAFT_52459 [Armillaria luteobubalina]|uniref:Uncharacterized protein n=1 Tax=Armillaria luteobubalina TaxID=153913 RepID=A0AA39QBT4_9AGAR|nr:hypothetical protein EDD18DRAFT_52459 [Armillaria luteobubalina]